MKGWSQFVDDKLLNFNFPALKLIATLRRNVANWVHREIIDDDPNEQEEAMYKIKILKSHSAKR